MITKQHSHYLKFLSKGHNILLLSDKHYAHINDISNEFNLDIQRVLNDEELDNLTNTLMQNNIDIVIIDFTLNTSIAKKMFESIKRYNERIVIIGIIKNEVIANIFDLINKLDSLLMYDFTLQELKDKLFTSLSIFYAIKAIGVRDMRIESGSSTSSDDLDRFFDTYEGQLVFIVDDLMELNKSLKAGDLSSDILKNVAKNMRMLADIFSKDKKISAVVEVFKDFSIYLETLKVETIQPQSLHAFDYLCAIIDDTITYMMEMFVDRVFKDVYIFHHSFENNLGFMKDALSLKSDEENHGELEFF